MPSPGGWPNDYGGLLHQWALAWAPTWLGAVGFGEAVVVHILVAVVGFGYSQVVFRAAQSGLDRALGRDWGVSRTAHFLLLGLPFLVALEGVLVMPGLLTGILTQLVVLALGGPFTDERPQGTVATLRCVAKSVRQAHADRASGTRLGSTRPEQSDAARPSSDDVRAAVSTARPGPTPYPNSVGAQVIILEPVGSSANCCGS